jgi:hypothetical protein
MRQPELTEEIAFELRQLERLAGLARAMLAVPPAERRPWDAMAAAKCVADLFRGLENLWKRFCVHSGRPFPSGPDSHARLLSAFLSESGLGNQVSPEFAERLKLYKDFRHRFVHGYGFEVSWELIEEPLTLLPVTAEELVRVWAGWLNGPRGKSA